MLFSVMSVHWQLIQLGSKHNLDKVS